MANSATIATTGEFGLSDVRSDEELFLACRDGDQTAFRVLVDRHLRMVRRLALNVLGDVQEAEDAAQEAFIAAWRARERWTPDARFSTWLHRIAVNKAIDRRRVRKAVPESQEVITRLADAEVQAPAQADALANLERTETAKTLQKALDKLPDTQRQALTMFYFEELDVGRIADAMDCSEQAVRSLLKRGRQTLKTRLQKQKKICGYGPETIRSPAEGAGSRA
ncbi:RNA polymerase subunit sigma-24 [Caulobacter sp. D4A]|uniref:RNA polymerase sigma factor n=1 Tax=unclassified Caulobacter TaxID=2648921 RepID=UPI000D72BFDC|nr:MULTISPECIES: sigma-70 family RNA polymerase sigma factor [unclassified Caulobacter]PXA82559.1 RNA polymerase subunit sigma-24 [Caulobacter sp. D4A]PXA93622.1 RNA polymerase subunit sigma-24 [Caulobacter sp. D5]